MGRAIVNMNSNRMGRGIVNYDFTDGREQDVMSSIDGNLVQYAIEDGNTSMPNPNIIEDRNLANGEISSGDFYDASGGMGGDDFYDATGVDNDTFADDSMPDQSIDQFENARGRKRKKRKKRGGFFNKLLDVQKQRQQAKFGAKDKMAQAQLESAKQQGALAQSDVATATALANASKTSGSADKTSEEKTGWSGLSKGAKIGIVVGGVAVLGFVGYMLLRKKK
jgi:hypothetical protein